MLVLALDTTTREGSLALARDGRLLDCWSGDGSHTHARRLPGDILDGLARHGLTLADVHLFAVAAGPGSFTGLRIGIATMQGLAFAHRRLVVGVSVLDALAYSAPGWPRSGSTPEIAGTPGSTASPAGEPSRIAAWMDAQRQEVFACLYEPGGGEAVGPGGEEFKTAADLGELRVIAGPQVGFPADVLAEPPWAQALRPSAGTRGGGPSVIWIGDGALAYRALIEEAAGGQARVVDPVPALAPAIGSIAFRRAGLGLATPPHAIRPVYIRRPDAELARDRRQRHAPDGQRDVQA